jgi:IS605 OrfB family transposase
MLEITYKAFKYRLDPTKELRHLLAQQAGACRFVYNWGLARWNEQYEQHKAGAKEKPTAFSLMRELTALKQNPDYLWLVDSEANSLNQSLIDLGKAFQNFFKKISKLPTFKKKYATTPSFRIPQNFEIDEDGERMRLSKLGWVRYKRSRQIEGVPKSITVKYHAGHWYVSVLCEIPHNKPIHTSKSCIGMDVGVTNLATVWDGIKSTFVQYTANLRKLNAREKVLQKQLSHKQKGSKTQKASNNFNKALLSLQKLRERIKDIRKDTLHKLTTMLSKNHAHIGVEDLKIENMRRSASGTVENPGRRVAQKRGLNREISRQGWRMLFEQLLYKQLWFGSTVWVVDAKNTSRTCPACNFCAKENRMKELFKCLDCDYTNHADIVGAMNIRSRLLGLQ